MTVVITWFKLIPLPLRTITSGTTGSISIPIIDDAKFEGNETFIVKITGVSGSDF